MKTSISPWFLWGGTSRQWAIEKFATKAMNSR